MAKTALYKNLIVTISLLDENFSRLITLGQVKSLKEAVDVIDISGLKNRVEKFSPFVDKVIDDIISKPENYAAADIDYLLKEVDWSLQQCNSYLALLKRVKGTTDANALTDPRTFAALTIYKGCLEKIVDKLNYVSVG